MKKNATELVFILDRSGSMSGLEADTIGGFNSMIEKQKLEPGEAVVTTILFDHMVETLHDRADIQKIQSMTNKDYYVQGSTALLDAVGSTIQHISHVHTVMGEDNVPEHFMVVITTDGMENSSKEFSAEAVKRLIQEKKEKNNWEFLFLGANIDAVKAAGHIGISADRAVNYHPDPMGTALNYNVVSETVSTMRQGKGVGANWKQRIDADFKGRKGR